MIAPGYEPRLMLNFHYIDVTYVPTADLIARQKEEEIRNRVRAMDMPKMSEKQIYEISIHLLKVEPKR